jgi:hypothetical protein
LGWLLIVGDRLKKKEINVFNNDNSIFEDTDENIKRMENSVSDDNIFDSTYFSVKNVNPVVVMIQRVYKLFIYLLLKLFYNYYINFINFYYLFIYLLLLLLLYFSMEE